MVDKEYELNRKAAALRDKIRAEAKEEYKDNSKDRLKKIISTKLKTTMIGSLAAFERSFGFLWGLDSEGNNSGKQLSDEESDFKELYDEVRAKVLDLGNQQIRNSNTEIDQYNVEWLRYQATFIPVK